MTMPTKEELNEIANAIQLSIASKVIGIKQYKDDSVNVVFEKSALNDLRLKKFVKIVGGSFQNLGKTLKIVEASRFDWPKLINFLLVTRLDDTNIEYIIKLMPQYRSIVQKENLRNLQANIHSIKDAANRVFEEVRNKKITLRILSEKTGLTQASLSKFKAGNDIRLSSLLKIIRALGLSLRVE